MMKKMNKRGQKGLMRHGMSALMPSGLPVRALDQLVTARG